MDISFISFNFKKLYFSVNRFGEVTTVRCLPEKYCAFVNFKLRDDANKAMQKLQVLFLI